MDPFPEEWEWLALFESEPTLTDREVPWCYNHLTFETKRGADAVRCDIEPGYNTLSIQWWYGGKEKVKLELDRVLGLRIVTGHGNDYLIATFRDPNLNDLEFHLKPEISLRWGTSEAV